MVELARTGRKPSELAIKFGCHETNISAWLRQAHADETVSGRTGSSITTTELQELLQLRSRF